MKRNLFSFILFLFVLQQANGQLYYTKNGSISFFSKSPLQDIEADNNQVISVLNIQSGQIEFSLLNNAFHFPKAKMEEDFNENYIESDTYPRSSFKGTLININKVDFTKDGNYPVMVKGDLTIHGITKNINANGAIIISKATISAYSSFTVFVKDYDIKIPTIVSNKIAEKIQIKINCSYQKK